MNEADWLALAVILAPLYVYLVARLIGVAWYRSKRNHLREVLTSLDNQLEQQPGGPNGK